MLSMFVTLEVSQLDTPALKSSKSLKSPLMSVTLEVSKLSGWLNADARCRGSKGGHTVQSTGRRQAAGDRGASSVQGRP